MVEVIGRGGGGNGVDGVETQACSLIGNSGSDRQPVNPASTFFLKLKISLRTLIPLFRPGLIYSGSAS